jgi:hypothetical protein
MTQIDEPDELLANTKNHDPRATRALQDHFWDMEDEPNLDEQIDSILFDLLGTPLTKDQTYQPTINDPYGVALLQNSSSLTTMPKTRPSAESYETVKRQYHRTSKAVEAIKALIATQIQEARIDELERFDWCDYEGCNAYVHERLAQLRNTQ